MIIGLIGFIGSGKDTVGGLLSSRGYELDSFARSLKKAVSIIFGWDLRLLEGDTPKSREWRNTIDDRWSSLMGRTVTPRMILQEFGTDVCQDWISKEVWVESLFRRKHSQDFAITDVRFSHEVRAVKERGGLLVRVMRGDDPWWVSIIETLKSDERTYFMSQFDIHRSEWDWVGSRVDFTIKNDSTLDALDCEVGNMIKYLEEL